MPTESIDALIRRMNDSPVLTRSQRRKLFRQLVDRNTESYIDGKISLRDVFEPVPMYDQDRASFDRMIREMDNDLDWQCQTVSDAFSQFQRNGQPPAPYFAMRIAILLRKQGDTAKEKEFLAAWCRHFRHEKHGVKYLKLVSRAKKLGAVR